MALTGPRDPRGRQYRIRITVFLLRGPGGSRLRWGSLGFLFLFSPATQSQDAVVQCGIQLACVFGAGLRRQGVKWQGVASSHAGQYLHM